MGVEPLTVKTADVIVRPAPFPLFEAHPAVGAVLARQPLMTGDTPVHRLTSLGNPSMWIKRDDMTAATYGGSKVRKLEFQLGAALASGKTRIAALGATGSHYLLAAALFARRLGLECEVLVADQFETAEADRNFEALRTHATSIERGGPEWRAALRFFIRSKLFAGRAMYLAPGGSCPLGTVGMVNAAFELRRQIADGQLPSPSAIVCALGSGGTLAGLTLGVALSRLDIEVIGVRTYPSHAGPIPTMTVSRVRTLMGRTWRLLAEADPSIPRVKVGAPRVIDDYLGGGYARPTEAGRRAQRLIADTEGIALDSTYTAKTVAAALDLQREFGSRPLLYWHTYGGPIDDDRRGPRSMQCAL